MPTQVALLRGINVGGRSSVPMAALRECFVALGHTDVRTYIQSGNVVFTRAGRPNLTSIEAAIEETFGAPVAVVLRTPAQLAAVLDANPFPDADPSRRHVGFLARKPAAAAVGAIDADRYPPEEFAVVGHEIYFHLPDGMGRAKLPPYVDRRLRVPMTVRNWNTVTKLVEMSGA